MQIKELIDKLSNPHWFKMPNPPPVIVSPGTEGAFNIYWYKCGMPELSAMTEGYISETKLLWSQAHAIARLEIEGVPIEETATVLGPSELYLYLCSKREDLAKRYLAKDRSVHGST